MKEIEGHCFELLDEYARRRHKSFLAEFFRDQPGTDFTLCFRPAGPSVSVKSEKRYACKYMHLRADEAQTTGSGVELPLAIAEKLDDELQELALSRDG